LNNNNYGTYFKYLGGSDYAIYLWDGTQGIVVDTGIVDWEGSLNDNNYGTYSDYNLSDSTRPIYMWDGTSSTSVSPNSFWQGSLNNNNYSTYDFLSGSSHSLYVYTLS
jgi:hypothetical protein